METSAPVQIIQLHPDDVFVIHHAGTLNQEKASMIRESFHKHFPGRRLLILDSRITLTIHRPSQSSTPTAAAG